MSQASTVRKAAGWSVFSGIINQLGQLAVTLVLAAILGPERFGVVALATLYLLLVDFLVRQGVVQAIIQRAELRAAHLDSAFALVMTTAVLLSGLTIVLAPAVARLFDAPALTDLLRVLAGVALLRGLWQIPIGLLERDLDFRRRSIVTDTGVALGGVAGVIAAFAGANEYAVAFQLYTQGVVSTVLAYTQTSWRPRWSFEWRAARELLSFSSGALLASLGAFVSQRIDTIVVGAFFGPLAVGLYRFASRLVQMVTHLTAGSLGRLGLASLSRVQDDPARFAQRTHRLMASSAAFSLPILGIVLVGARVLVELFGEEWSGAVPVMRILAFAGIARLVVVYTNPIQQARGHAHRSAAALWFASAVSVGAVAFFGAAVASGSVESQVRGIALARLMAQALIITPVFLMLIASAASTTVRRLVESVLPALEVTTVVVVLGLLLDRAIARTDLNLVTQGAVVGTATATVAAVGVLIISDEARLLVRKLQGRVTDR